MANYKSILLSQPFNFLIGKERTSMTIHSGVVEAISKPLSALINNGQMRESNSREAVLENEEEATFVGFCEYAYTGTYMTPAVHIPETETQGHGSGPSVDGAGDRDGKAVSAPNIPILGPEIEDPWGFSTTARAKSSRNKFNSWGCMKEPASDRSTSERLWEDFRSLKFPGASASVSPHPDLLFHVKLYVFATKYLIDSLRMQCVKSLHRDLCDFSLNKESVQEIIDLLHLTYTATGRANPGGAPSLRDLVIGYVACEGRTLADDERFCCLLDSYGEMGRDLVTRLVR